MTTPCQLGLRGLAGVDGAALQDRPRRAGGVQAPGYDVVEQLVDRAAALRQRSVAYVTAAGPLSTEQEQRLTDVLKAIYRRPISVKVDIDPALIGGLVIRVGDEVIDGSVAAKLEQARQWMSR